MADLDKFSYHELLDRSAVFAATFEEHIQGHPVAMHNPEIKKEVDEIMGKLGNLYQLVGKVTDETWQY